MFGLKALAHAEVRGNISHAIAMQPQHFEPGYHCALDGGKAPPGCVVAVDATNVSSVTALDSSGATVGTSDDGFIEFKEDTRQNITFRATNFLGLASNCTTEVVTFTTVRGWDQSLMDAQMKSASETPTAGAWFTYYEGSEYRIQGPSNYGFHKECAAPQPTGPVPSPPSTANRSGCLFESHAGRGIVFQVDVVIGNTTQSADPGLLFIDQASGQIIVNPLGRHVNDQRYTATLRGLDSQGARAVVKRWEFEVRDKPVFATATDWDPSTLGLKQNFRKKYVWPRACRWHLAHAAQSRLPLHLGTWACQGFRHMRRRRCAGRPHHVLAHVCLYATSVVQHPERLPRASVTNLPPRV